MNAQNVFAFFIDSGSIFVQWKKIGCQTATRLQMRINVKINISRRISNDSSFQMAGLTMANAQHCVRRVLGKVLKL